MKKLIGFVLLVGLVSCQSNIEKETVVEKAPLVEVDSPVIEPIQVIDFNLDGPIIDSVLLKKFKNEFELPFHLDTTLLEDLVDDEDSNPLSLDEYKSLTIKFAKNVRSERNDWYLEQMVKFKKMSKSELEEYEDQLDIGQLAFSNIYPYGKLMVSDSTQLLIWYMRHSTMDACPFGFGQVFYGTLITSNQIQCSMPIAEYSGGGDPPIGREVKMDFLLNNSLEITQRLSDVLTDEFPSPDGGYDLKTKEELKLLKGFVSRDTILTNEILPE